MEQIKLAQEDLKELFNYWKVKGMSGEEISAYLNLTIGDSDLELKIKQFFYDILKFNNGFLFETYEPVTISKHKLTINDLNEKSNKKLVEIKKVKQIFILRIL